MKTLLALASVAAMIFGTLHAIDPVAFSRLLAVLEKLPTVIGL
jgi:hypothetical protein